MKLQTEDEILLLQLARKLKAAEDEILKDVQKKFCSTCAGAGRLVYRSPEAYQIGQILETLRIRGTI